MINNANKMIPLRFLLITLILFISAGFKWPWQETKFDALVPVSVYVRDINRADGLILDSHNNLCIASEKSRGYVLRFSLDGQRKTLIKGLDHADGLAIDKQDNLYISAETTAGYITQLKTDGSSSVLISGITKPEGIVFDSRQRLYIAEDHKNGRILRYEAGQLETIADRLQRPEGIAIDDHDNLYINETSTNKILRLDPERKIETFLDAGTMFKPDGICYCSAYDGLFVTEDQNPGRLIYFDMDKNMTIIVKKLDSPQGITCDKTGNVYFSEQGKDRILKISAEHLRPLLKKQSHY